MAQYVALKTFLGRFGQMHKGMTYTLPDGYARDLQNNRLVRPLQDKAPRNVAHEGAPSIAGEDMAGQPGDGLGPLSSASLPGRRSRKPTVTTQNLGPGAYRAPRK